MYMALFDPYSAYTDAHDGTFTGPTKSTFFSRATSARGNIYSRGCNAGGVYLRPTALQYIEKLPNDSLGSAFGGEKSNLKIVSQLVSASKCFNSSFLPDVFCKTKV